MSIIFGIILGAAGVGLWLFFRHQVNVIAELKEDVTALKNKIEGK